MHLLHARRPVEPKQRPKSPGICLTGVLYSRIGGYMLSSLLRDANGQDIVEYTLLVSFIVVVSAALFLVNGSSISTIWSITDNNLSRAQRGM